MSHDRTDPSSMTVPKSEPVNRQPKKSGRVWFSLPEPIKRTFDEFPLKTYAANELAHRARHKTDQNVLHIFTSIEDARDGAPSYNPACLKWQAFLKFKRIDFMTIPSNNHASLNGVLPFLLPASLDSASTIPVPANKISKWVASSSKCTEESTSMRHEAYTALLDVSIRNAWLYNLYLDQSNFDNVGKPLYIARASSSAIVQTTIAYQLQRAAREEILKTFDIIDRTQLMSIAKQAFNALSILLGEKQYFFGEENPSIFDASVFAYTQLIMELKWSNNELKTLLQSYENLLAHQKHLQEKYFRK